MTGQPPGSPFIHRYNSDTVHLQRKHTQCTWVRWLQQWVVEFRGSPVNNKGSVIFILIQSQSHTIGILTILEELYNPLPWKTASKGWKLPEFSDVQGVMLFALQSCVFTALATPGSKVGKHVPASGRMMRQIRDRIITEVRLSWKRPVRWDLLRWHERTGITIAVRGGSVQRRQRQRGNEGGGRTAGQTLVHKMADKIQKLQAKSTSY